MRNPILAHVLVAVAAVAGIATLEYQFVGDVREAGFALLTGSSAMLAFLWVV